LPILKTKWRRSIAVLLCVMLMFCAAFSLTAYFTGSVTLTNGINGTYDLMDDMPEGKQILGHTGADQETLTIKIPVAYANGSYTLCAYGMDHLPTAKLFFWAPSVYNQQRIVTSTLDGSQDVFVRGFLTVKTPSATVQPQKGSLQITKTDDSGNPLSGVGFTLYDASKRAISTKSTDSSGIVTFSDLDLGNYYYAETSALPGYVLDSAQYQVSISANGQIVKKTMTNTPEKGGLQITKTDDSGNPLSGVGFTLYDSSKRTISTKTTDSSGIATFSEGDEVTITNIWGTLRYQVTETQIIAPNDVNAILIRPGRDMITLLTCHPPNTGGRFRYLVFCERVKE